MQRQQRYLTVHLLPLGVRLVAIFNPSPAFAHCPRKCEFAECVPACIALFRIPASSLAFYSGTLIFFGREKSAGFRCVQR
jgi:hypothetical protein